MIDGRTAFQSQFGWLAALRPKEIPRTDKTRQNPQAGQHCSWQAGRQRHPRWPATQDGQEMKSHQSRITHHRQDSDKSHLRRSLLACLVGAVWTAGCSNGTPAGGGKGGVQATGGSATAGASAGDRTDTPQSTGGNAAGGAATGGGAGTSQATGGSAATGGTSATAGERPVQQPPLAGPHVLAVVKDLRVERRECGRRQHARRRCNRRHDHRWQGGRR